MNVSFSLWLLIICSKQAYSIEQTQGKEIGRDWEVGGLVCSNPPKTRHMRHTVLVLIREPILQDKSEMEGRFGGEGDEGGGTEEEEREGGKSESEKLRERDGRVLI